MSRRAIGRLPGLALAAGVASGCLSFDERILRRDLPAEPSEEQLLDADAGTVAPPPLEAGALVGDPHALLGISPNHGPFGGGNTVSLRGNGFTSAVRVWFGDEPASDVIGVDPHRVQATVPPGAAGPVDVVVQNGDDPSTRRVLEAGYEYDAFVVEPSAGPTTGGTLLTLTSASDEWDDDTQVTIDLVPCEVEDVRKTEQGSFQIQCRTAPNTPGRKVVTVDTADGAETSVAGAFAYSDYRREYEGGFSGDPLAGTLEVRVFDGLSGQPLPGASVILGSDYDERRVKLTPTNGQVHFRDAELGDAPLGSAVTVTVAMACRHPLTLVDVPVERVTVFLLPILTPDCLPPSFGTPAFGGGAGAAPTNRVSGELVWGEGLEFRPSTWSNVPNPQHDEESHIAYVLELTTSPDNTFNLPSRFDAVTLDDRGTFGYVYTYDTRSLGAITLYALAGVEDRSVIPYRFTPYVMGLLRGIDPASEPSGLLMHMNITLDHALAFELSPPVPTDQGPDRALVRVGLRVGASGYLPLPNLRREELLPRSSPISLVGLPALAGKLAGAEYLAQITTASGPDGALPLSHIDLLSTRQTDAPLLVSDFVPVPVFRTPTQGAAWDGRTLEVEFAAGGPFDLLRFDLLSTSQAMTWRIVAPGHQTSVRLPPLAEYGHSVGSGWVTVGAAAARVKNFDYANLKERNYVANGFGAFAANSIAVVLP